MPMPKPRRCFTSGTSMVTFYVENVEQVDEIQESIIEKK
jgi:hypothetical protein